MPGGPCVSSIRRTDQRPGGPVEADRAERGQFGVAGDTFGEYQQADGVGNPGKPAQESGITRVAVNAADEARVDLQEVQPQIVQLSDLAEVVAKVFEADAAAGLINWSSPLGRALLGAQLGDEVLWQRPAGDQLIEIIRIQPA